MSINRQLDVAACLDAHRNFIAQGHTTFCNVYACAFLGMRGHVIPLNMSANELYDWFSSPRAVALGWRKSTHDETLAVANAGGDAVAIIQGTEHGHIAVCVESLPTTPGVLCVSAAGRSNFVRAPMSRSFGEGVHPTFFINIDD
jgi:hypothetical protein